MKTIFDWMLENKEWLFSGIGVSVVVWLLFGSSRKSSQTIRSGKNSTNIQAGGDVNIGRDKDDDVFSNNKQSNTAGGNSVNVNAGRDAYIQLTEKIPKEFVDKHIKEEVEVLQKARSFGGYDREGSATRLGQRLVEGDLSGGSDDVRGIALAWCSRLLSTSEKLDEAEGFLEQAKVLTDSIELKIAEAFIFSKHGDKVVALQSLTKLDTDASRSARLFIVSHHEDADKALSWKVNAGYSTMHFDGDGKHFILNNQLQLGHWEDLKGTLDSLTESDYDQTPCLYCLAAISHLISVIPEEFRSTVVGQVPFEMGDFPLADTADAIETRRTAHGLFNKALKAATQLHCLQVAKVCDEYALWLELRDPEWSADGKRRLEEKLGCADTRLGFVNFAVQFGIKLDIPAVEKEIEQDLAKNGGMTSEAAFACYAIAFTKPTAEEVAEYIVRYQEQLSTYINPKPMQFLLVELYSRAGMAENANEVYKKLFEQGITGKEKIKLKRIIDKAAAIDPVQALKAQYESSGELSDLINLVNQLQAHQHWGDLSEFGRQLYDQTQSLTDAERLVRALNCTHQSDKLVSFLDNHDDLLQQSSQLQLFHAWGLFHEGALLRSREVLAGLKVMASDPNYRQLQVNLGIATGDWASVSGFVDNEYQNRNHRSAGELINSAQLAYQIGSPHAKNLVLEAVSKADSDPKVLATAYHIASKYGWESESIVSDWLKIAIGKSDEDGPFQRATLKDLLDQKPEWDRRESNTLKQLTQGQMPMFIAAQLVNQTLVALMSTQSFGNAKTTDPRRRSQIPAYSGKRLSLPLDIQGKTVALDATALLTLSYLDIIDIALDACQTVFISHATLGWLFDERQKVAFHQPSRIQDAHVIQRLIMEDSLERFISSTDSNSELAVQVGDELATLIAEAERTRDDDNSQHLVVQPYPVHRVSSLMEEVVDLSSHSSVLSSCLAVVDKLKQKGLLTSDEEGRARDYLQLQEQPWPNQPSIEDGATLYLDGLSVSYLHHLGLLDKLKLAGLRAIVSPAELAKVTAFISHESTLKEVEGIIERLRGSLHARIESGNIVVGRVYGLDNLKEDSISGHPTASMFSLPPVCDVAVIDDRYLNQHLNVNTTGKVIPVVSTLDLLDSLVRAGDMSADARWECRTRLRRAGYIFIPILEEELTRHLNESGLVDGNLVETAELKVIRESIQKIKMSDWLQLPQEAPWLCELLRTFIGVLKNQWITSEDIDKCISCSNWILDLIDIHGWAHRYSPEEAENLIKNERSAFILMLLSPPVEVSQSTRDAYFSWIEERLLLPIKEQSPRIYERLLDWYSNEFMRLVEAQTVKE